MSGGGLNRLLKQQQQEDWLGPALDAAARGKPERWEDPVMYVRPSSAGLPCTRAAQLVQLGHRYEETPHLRALFEAGKDLEKRVQARYREAGLLEDHNVRLWVYTDGSYTTGDEPRGGMGEVVWSGEADLLVRNHFGEVKKMHPFRQRKFPKPVADPEQNAAALLRAEPKYAVQFFQYIHRHGEHLNTDPVAFVHVEDEWGEYQILWVRPTSQHIAKAFEVSRAAEQASAEGELIEPPPFTRLSKTCRGCDHERVCYDLQDGDKEAWGRVKTALATVRAWHQDRVAT